jgi:signal transduction histidine kinase
VQAAQQAQRDFVANVSHELKTPLTSIQGFAQAMLDGAAASPEALRQSAHVIFDEAGRMRRLVEELLDLARLDAAGALRREPIDLALILAAVADRFGPRALEQQVALRTDIALLPAMVGDGDRLAQVFTNLVDNALKHTAPGGSVTLTAASAPGGVEAAVRDSGSGIPSEDLTRIFERFYQVDKSRARSGGAGLGLAITKGIVEAHGGQISVHSAVGAGTAFRVFLPAARADDSTVARRRGR